MFIWENSKDESLRRPQQLKILKFFSMEDVTFSFYRTGKFKRAILVTI